MRATRGRQRLLALTLLAFPPVHFWFISTQTLQYGRYLMPLGPMLCLGLAAGIVAIVDRLAPPRARGTCLVLLPLLLLAPSAASALSWNRAHGRVTTAEQAAEWLVTHAPAGTRVVIEASAIHLPPRFPVTRTNTLTTRSVEDYQRDGITYLMASSQRSDRDYADPVANRAAITAHQTMMALTEPVATFVPDADHAGATVTILRVPPRPD
jgi:hypothetical protein